jgi:glyoxylase-like metal-dependent hydrolase (beta-lactamase superfamily II)
MTIDTRRIALAAILASVIPFRADAAGSRPSSAPPAFEEIAAGVHLLRGRFVPGRQPDGNSVLFRGPGGLVLVDTGRHPEHTQILLDFAKAADRPIVAVVNTHWHLDHVGGNPVVRRAYPAARVYASSAIDAAREGFLADYRGQLQAMIDKTPDAEAQKPWRAEIAIIDSGDALGPDVRIGRAGDHSLAGRRLHVGFASHAATAGDLWILDPATKVLVAGDLLTLPAPFLDTACPSGWQAALGTLSKVDFTTVIPGHGPPLTRHEFDAYRAAFDGLLACAASGRTRDACIDEWTKAEAPLLKDEDPTFLRGVVGYYVDVLRQAPGRREAHCRG